MKTKNLVPFFQRFFASINSLHKKPEHYKKFAPLVGIFSFFFSFKSYSRNSVILIELYLYGEYRIKT